MPYNKPYDTADYEQLEDEIVRWVNRSVGHEHCSCVELLRHEIEDLQMRLDKLKLYIVKKVWGNP